MNRTDWIDTFAACAPAPGERVLLGMSGGVDSAVSAHHLVERGFDVVGVTLKNYCYGEDSSSGRACCSVESIDRARSVAAGLGFPHRVVDVAEWFGSDVVRDFEDGYRNGVTPNPCVRCNAQVRFPALWDWADRLGARYVATGHYARILKREAGRDGAHRLARGRDAEKDQSYFLYDVPREEYPRMLFPLGESTKPEVRAMARERGLEEISSAPESMEVCFLTGRNLEEYLQEKIELEPGVIVDEDGRHLGSHRGAALYTVGQRRGLGVSAAEPLYVLEVRAAENLVVVGPRERLGRTEISCRNGWLLEEASGEGARLTAKIRYRGRDAALAGARLDGDSLRVILEDSVEGVSPGQALVIYDEDRVVGGGRIHASAGRPERTKATAQKGGQS